MAWENGPLFSPRSPIRPTAVAASQLPQGRGNSASLTPQSTTLEILLNGRLAELLRQQGLEAEAEQVLKDHKGNRHQIDVLVELEDQAVAIEAEFAPARTVQADARKRLPAKPLLWRGLPISSAFTLVYPQELQKRVESRARKELEERQDLEFAQFLPEEIHPQHQLFPEAAGGGGSNRRNRRISNHVGRMPAQLLAAGRQQQPSREAPSKKPLPPSGQGRPSAVSEIAVDVHPHADADTDAAATSVADLAHHGQFGCSIELRGSARTWTPGNPAATA